MSLSYKLEQINEAAARCISAMNGKKVLALHGPMGAGKTTLVHAICDLKRVSSPVSSPTFALINEYNSPEGPIFHIDLYRLESEEEAIRAGIEDCLSSGEICLVEWPEKAAGLFPENTVHVFIHPVDADTRILSLQS